MLKRSINRVSAISGAAFTMGLMSSGQAFAGGNTFNTISSNIQKSISDLPGMLSGISYIMGMIFAVLGILKIKDHVENPSQTPLKDGAIRLAVGGGLFTIPIITEAMTNLIGASGTAAEAAKVTKIEFNLK